MTLGINARIASKVFPAVGEMKKKNYLTKPILTGEKKITKAQHRIFKVW